MRPTFATQAQGDRLRHAERVAQRLGCRVAVLEPHIPHWRVTTPAGAVFDYWPTRETARIADRIIRWTSLRVAIERADLAAFGSPYRETDPTHTH